jgi:hypothetical protein
VAPELPACSALRHDDGIAGTALIENLEEQDGTTDDYSPRQLHVAEPVQ